MGRPRRARTTSGTDATLSSGLDWLKAGATRILVRPLRRGVFPCKAERNNRSVHHRAAKSAAHALTQPLYAVKDRGLLPAMTSAYCRGWTARASQRSEAAAPGPEPIAGDGQGGPTPNILPRSRVRSHRTSRPHAAPRCRPSAYDPVPFADDASPVAEPGTYRRPYPLRAVVAFMGSANAQFELRRLRQRRHLRHPQPIHIAHAMLLTSAPQPSRGQARNTRFPLPKVVGAGTRANFTSARNPKRSRVRACVSAKRLGRSCARSIGNVTRAMASR